MFSKIAVLVCVLAVANAGYFDAPAGAAYAAEPAVASYAAPAYTSYGTPAYAEPTSSASSENMYRGADNLHTLSTQSKTVATPYFSSNKYFAKASNPGVYAQTTSYTDPASDAYAAPAAHDTYPAPVAYSAPVAHAAYSQAADVSHVSYSSPTGINYSW